MNTENLLKHHLLIIIHADLECLIEKINECKSNSENSSTTKVVEDLLQYII